MNFKCLIGLHDYIYTRATYQTTLDQRMAVPAIEAKRTCVECGKHQSRDEHCLGLNPPEYYYTWYTKK